MQNIMAVTRAGLNPEAVIADWTIIIENVGKATAKSETKTPEEFVHEFVAAYGFPITDMQKLGSSINEHSQWCHKGDENLEPEIMLMPIDIEVRVMCYPYGFVAVLDAADEVKLMTRMD